MRQLPTSDRCRIVACLVEGNSIRATCRITGFAKKTVERLAREIGEACDEYADHVMRDLPCEQIQCDEIWAFVGAKARNVRRPDQIAKQWGDIWTWVAIDPKTKLIPSWYLGDRSAHSAYRFTHDLRPRLRNRVQLTTDGHNAYLVAVKAAWLDGPVDYGMLVKLYGEGGEGKYSPSECLGARKETIMGNPLKAAICTSHVERQNLTMRMQMRRFTRLTNGFSKSVEAHSRAVALHFVHYNFCRIHQSLRITPAMAAGISDHVWDISELIALLERRWQLPLAA